MKYNEIIHVSDDFIPVFDLENEETDQYWPLFIPNDKFRDILSSVLDSLDPVKQKNPIWLQGTYGTGKTHATSVIKHLICDEEEPDYDLDDPALTAKLNNFRAKTKVFPVILKGTSTIEGPRRFTLTVQTAVKKALKKSDIRVAVSSEFEHMVSILDEYPLKEEDTVGTNLEFFDNDEIILRLKNEDSDVLIDVEDIFMNKGISTVTQGNIVDWLTDVRNKLNESYGIDYLMIFWDEFTGALNMINVDDILLQVQNIAEAKYNGISLFIVSHRTRSTQVSINQEVINKIMNRFERKFYSMEPVATYELMERSIKKEPEWENVKNSFVDVITPLVDKISENEGIKVKKALEDLYPIHPYTAYLATFIAQEIGSTERSIFKFLHAKDIDYGFRSFIDTFEIDERFFLTADYLWDFFYDDFEDSEDEKISSSIKKYKLHVDNLKEKNEEYLVIFKVILLLNVLYKIAEVGKGSLAIPSEKNIKNVFIGSIYQDKVDVVLNYIDEHNIINRTPDGLFEITTNSLPAEQVNAEKEKLRKTLKLEDIIFNKKRNITKEFTDKVLRESEVQIRDAAIPENRLISDLERGMFKESGYLHIIVFLCKTNEEYIKINKVIKSVFDKDLLNNTIIVVSEAILGEDNYDKYLEFKARARVAESHNYKEDVDLNNKHADKYINTWVNDIKRKTVTWYLNDKEGKSPLSNFIKDINTDLSRSIFYYGLENIFETLSNRNLWPRVVSKNQAEKYLTSNSLIELNDSLKGIDQVSLAVLRDNNGNYIVDQKLELKPDVSNKHPIIVIQDFVDKSFEDAQTRGQFNLGEELMPLTKPPYGLYPNKINVAAISFVLRKYVTRLYDAKGNSIDKTKMKNIIVSLFKFWSKGKKGNDLLIRFGSESEKKLSEIVNDVFDLELDQSEQSISTVRWKLREWIKINRSPLWLFKYSEYIEKNPSVSPSIDTLFDFLKPKDNNLPDDLIQDCYNRVKVSKSDLKWCIKENSVDLFNKFLTGIDEDLTQNDIQEINAHLDKYMPEEVYDWDENTVRLNVLEWIRDRNKKINRKKPNLSVSIDESILSVSIDKEATGNINVHVSGKKYSKEIVNGEASFDLSNLDGGKTYSVMISYDGDENFLENNTTVEFGAVRKDPNMQVSIEGNKITVSLDKKASGNILVDVDKGYFAKIKNGVATINLSDLEGGKTYKGTVSYEGDGKFTNDEISVEFKAERESPNMQVSIEGNKITVSIDKNATGNILISVDGKDYSNEITNGISVINLSDLEGGKTYNVLVSYEGNTRFTDAKDSVVLKTKSKISIESIEKSDANIVKNALIEALKDNDEITIEIIVNYLERINGGNN